jgi:hypothetical protein
VPFCLTPDLDEDKIFMVGRGKVLTRLDPRFHQALRAYAKLVIVDGQPLKSVISTMFSGGTPNTQNPAYWEGSIPWISPKDFGEFEMISASDSISEIAVKESSTKIAPKDSVVLVVRSGVLVHTIPIAVTGTRMAINQDVKAIICGGSILPRYLATYFRVFQDWLLPVITKFGATVQSINTAELKNIEIPVLPLETQSKVVSLYMDALASVKDKNERASSLLDGIDSYILAELGITLPPKQEQSIANRVFTAQWRELSGWRFDPDMAVYSRHTRTSRFQLSRLKEHMLAPPQYGANERGVERVTRAVPRYVRITDVNDFGELSAGLGVAAEVAEAKYLLEPDDLLFARSGNTVGKTYLHAETDDEKHIFAGYMIRFRLNAATLLPKYVFAFTLCSAYKEWCSAVQRAAGQPNINAEEYKSLLIPIPPLEKQAEIAAHVFEIREQARRLRQQAETEFEAAKRRIEAMLLGEVTA